MNLAINYNYKIQYLPTSRHKKTREACMEEVMDVMIPELTEEEFPLAFEVTKMESVYPGAKDYRDFERQREESEYRLFTQQIRKYQGKLYKEVFATYGVGISTLHACPEEYIRHVLRKKTYRYVPEQDFPYKKDVSVIVSSEKKDMETSLENTLQKYKIFNGILWKLCAEPCYEVSYSGPGAYVDIVYSSTEKLQTFQYASNEREKLLDDLKAHQEKYNLKQEEICFSCCIRNFDDAAVQHYHPQTLVVSIFCQAMYNASVELPKDFSGNLEDAIDYADDHLRDIPLGSLQYVPDSDDLDRDSCYLV